MATIKGMLEAPEIESKIANRGEGAQAARAAAVDAGRRHCLRTPQQGPGEDR